MAFRKRFIQAGAALTMASFSLGQVSVVTQRYDNLRTGANLQETVLNVSNVKAPLFGKLASLKVDKAIIASPVLAAGVNINGAVRNVLYVVTNSATLYAFDADNFADGLPLWKRKFPGGVTGFSPGPCAGAPVINMATQTLYVVIKTLDGVATDSNNFKMRLYALDLASGLDRPNSPAILQATGPGTGDYSVGGIVNMDGQYHHNRPALLLDHGYVYVGISSIQDNGKYHGWVLAYDATTLQKTGTYLANPNGHGAGIWMSGCGPSADADGNIYVASGNANAFFDQSLQPGPHIGQSVIKLKKGSLEQLDYFTPYNAKTLNGLNSDVGVTGVFLVPGTNLALSIGKQGLVYVMNKDNLGGRGTTFDNVVQTFQATELHPHGGFVYYDGGPSFGKQMFMWGEEDVAKSFRLNGGSFLTQPTATSDIAAPDGMPGGMISLTANGQTPGSAVLWASLPLIGDAVKNWTPGILRAFDASNLTELWNSRTKIVDDTDIFAKFVPPTVVNGKVYQPNYNLSVNVYGLLNQAAPPKPSSPVITNANGAVKVYWPRNPNTTSTCVWRATSSLGPFTLVASGLTGLGYKDTGLVNNKSYYYRTTSLNPVGESLPSAVIAARPTVNAETTTFTRTQFDAAANIQVNGAGIITGGSLVVSGGTDGSFGSGFYIPAVGVGAFKTTFKFKLNGPNAHGLTFVINRDTAPPGGGRSKALGGAREELGYGPELPIGKAIRGSVAIKFARDNDTASYPFGATGLCLQGRTVKENSLSLQPSGVNLYSAHTFEATVTYDGFTLTSTIKDLSTNATDTRTYTAYIPAEAFSSAYAGFTGSSEAGSSVEVLSWTWAPLP